MGTISIWGSTAMLHVLLQRSKLFATYFEPWRFLPLHSGGSTVLLSDKKEIWLYCPKRISPVRSVKKAKIFLAPVPFAPLNLYHTLNTLSGPWVCDGSTLMVRKMKQFYFGDGKMQCPVVPSVVNGSGMRWHCNHHSLPIPSLVHRTR